MLGAFSDVTDLCRQLSSLLASAFQARPRPGSLELSCSGGRNICLHHCPSRSPSSSAFPSTALRSSRPRTSVPSVAFVLPLPADSHAAFSQPDCYASVMATERESVCLLLQCGAGTFCPVDLALCIRSLLEAILACCARAPLDRQLSHSQSAARSDWCLGSCCWQQHAL